MRADERALLGPWVSAFALEFGARPALTEHLPGRWQLTFPRVVGDLGILSRAGFFQPTSGMPALLRRLGWAWDAEGWVLTVPTPGSLGPALDAEGLSTAGFRPEYDVVVDRATGPWLARVLEGTWPVPVRPRWSYERAARRRALLDRRRASLVGRLQPSTRSLARSLDSERTLLRSDLEHLVHDLANHVLVYALCPRDRLEALHARARRAFADRLPAWRLPGARAPRPLAHFYDLDLMRYAYGVWRLAGDPAEFAAVFSSAGNWAQLSDVFNARLSESRAAGDALPEPVAASRAATEGLQGLVRRLVRGDRTSHPAGAEPARSDPEPARFEIR